MAAKSEQVLKLTRMEVTSGVVDVGAEVAKAMSPGTRYRYYVDVKYEAEDGTIVPGCVKGMTKPKLQERIKDRHEDLARGWMKATRYSENEPWCVFLSMTIRLR